MVSRLSISGIALLEYNRFIILGVRSLDKQWLLSTGEIETKSTNHHLYTVRNSGHSGERRVVFGDSDFIITVEMQSNAK